jgi:hypothetical protein
MVVSLHPFSPPSSGVRTCEAALSGTARHAASPSDHRLLWSTFPELALIVVAGLVRAVLRGTASSAT